MLKLIQNYFSRNRVSGGILLEENSISLAELLLSLSLGRKMLYGCETLMESPEHAPRLIAIISKEQEITL